MHNSVSGRQTSTMQNALRIFFGLAMLGAGIGHLTFLRNEFQAQVPRWLAANNSFVDFVVVASGIVEIAFGVAMLWGGKHKVKTGIALAVFYVLIFPGNISQYANGINGFGLDTDSKRLLRLFFQPVLIFGALWCTGALGALLNRQKSLSAGG